MSIHSLESKRGQIEYLAHRKGWKNVDSQNPYHKSAHFVKGDKFVRVNYGYRNMAGIASAYYGWNSQPDGTWLGNIDRTGKTDNALTKFQTVCEWLERSE